MTTRMPVLFVGHGSPMNAIEDNGWSRGFQELAALLPAKPSAVLAVSAHWYVPGTYLTAQPHPETIHDFGGFPQALYEVQYPAPGQPDLARKVSGMLAEVKATAVNDWGLDHGTWSVLHHTFPQADVPVVQLSIDYRLAPAKHLALARALAPLRDEGVLVLASGNVTHNLRHAFTSFQRGDLATPDWARDFDKLVQDATQNHDGAALAKALEGNSGRLSHPSPDHYYPLLYAAGASDKSDKVSFPIAGFDMGSLSMRSILFG